MLNAKPPVSRPGMEHRGRFMMKHIGHDHRSGYRFHITEIDPDSRKVAIQYDETAWQPGVTVTDQIDWTEFLEHLIDGRFEIRRPG